MDESRRVSNTSCQANQANGRSGARVRRVARGEQPAPESRRHCGTGDEDALIRSAMHGDLEAFNHLVLAYQDRIYHQAYRLLGDPLAADDAAQEAFIAAYQALPGYRGGSFRRWLSRIVTNKCLDELRGCKSHPTTSFELYDASGEELESPAWCADPGETPEERLLRSELVKLLERCLERLSPEQRTTIVLVDVLGMDYAEAGEAMSCPLGTVKSRLARARSQMRRFLQMK
jgi:RNA polymerase sigma-70 factor (ECF subfamily)